MNQPRVELAADHLQRLEELDEALERQVLGLDGDDHPVGGGERVDRHRAERRRAVEQRERRSARGPGRGRRGAGTRSARRAAARPRRRRGRGSPGRSRGCRARPGARPRRSSLAARHVVGGRMGLAVEAERDRRVALRVEVDEQHLPPVARRAGGEVDGGGGLPHPALLIRDRVDGSHPRSSVETPEAAADRVPAKLRVSRETVRGRAERALPSPSRRGAAGPRGSGPALRIRCRWRCSLPANGPDRERPRSGSIASRAAARSSSASSSGSRRPFQATSSAAVAEQRRGELGERAEPRRRRGR